MYQFGCPSGLGIGATPILPIHQCLQHILKLEGDDDPQKNRDDKLQHIFYADDLQIYLRVSIGRLEYGVAELSKVADRVLKWSGNAALKLNAIKTKSINVAPKTLSTGSQMICPALW